MWSGFEVSSCEHGNEPSGAIKAEISWAAEELQIFKKDPHHWTSQSPQNTSSRIYR